MESFPSVTGESEGMARIVGGIVNDFHVGEADETDDEQAKQGRHAKRNNLRSRNARCHRSGIRNHRIVLSPSTRGPFQFVFSLGRSPGSRIERLTPAFPDFPVASWTKTFRLQLRGQPRV
jgi:hypothetical protein